MLLSGDIKVNPGPTQFLTTAYKGIPKTQDKIGLEKFEMFNKRGLHFIHVNINSILPKRNDLSYNVREYLDSSNETIFFDIFLPHSKPILISIFYRPPNDTQFLKTFQCTIENAKEFLNQELYIMGEMNIIMDKNMNDTSIMNEYNGFCKNHGLSQIIKTHTHITKTSSSLIDHILTNSQDRTSQLGVIETTFSDRFSIFCTRKTTRNKFSKHKTIKIRLFKNYDKNAYFAKLMEIDIPEVDEHSNIDEKYNTFGWQLTEIIDSVAPFHEIRVKHNTPDWFDGEIMD